MKTLILFLILLVNIVSYGQDESTLSKNFRTDFAIPEHPAFSVLNSSQDNILRPSDSKELFSVIYSNFLSGSSFLIPKELSIEFAPIQLIGINTITLDKYRDNNINRILNDSKLSICAKIDSNDSLKKLAIGFRIPWIDEKSLVRNSAFLSSSYNYLYNKREARDHYRDSIVKNNISIRSTVITDEILATNDELSGFIDSLFEKSFRDSLNILREKYKKLNWNMFKFETAFAVKFDSQDSLVSNSHYSKFELYNTIAFPLGNGTNNERPGWGQGLLGFNISDERLDSLQITYLDTIAIIDTIKYKKTILSFATRLYAGTNNFKSFIEVGYKSRLKTSKDVILTVGIELNLTNGLWVLLNFGNDWSKINSEANIDNKWSSHMFGNIDLRFHLPEKKIL
jgi:hypothetical protein